MLKKVRIQHYKSIQDLTLKLGRVNVFIGENGCGKSNILESIAFSAAAESDKLDNEFLSSRGIRVTQPELMCANFEGQRSRGEIHLTLSFSDKGVDREFYLHNDNAAYSKWTYSDVDKETREYRHSNECRVMSNENQHKMDEMLEGSVSEFYASCKLGDKFKTFIIFSPESSALRNFHREGQIEPLGIKGEGLLKLLKVLSEEYADDFEIMKEQLELFDWYDSLQVPSGYASQENNIQIKDKYLNLPFDQHSANEGFLFVLFYMALIVSKDTPDFFAVDNIDASFNPKLCTKIIKVLVELSKKYDKQMLLTTHNPAILDGIDLGDCEQKLYVISRNKQGHTRAKEITTADKPISSNAEPLKLSEAMLRGYLGGLPKNF